MFTLKCDFSKSFRNLAWHSYLYPPPWKIPLSDIDFLGWCGVDTTLLKTHFVVATDAVGALRFPVKSNKFLPTVNLVCSLSSFSGCTLHTILPYVTFLYFGTCVLGMKIIIFVPFTILIPWANCTSSSEKDIYKISCLGLLPDVCIPGQLQIFDG